MKSFVSILRGINVGGNRIIKMEALRSLYASLGFRDVQTHIQSGNVIFQAPDVEPGETASRISSAIAAEFGFEVPVLVLGADELAHIVERNPFAGNPAIALDCLHVTFLPVIPDTGILEELPAGISGEDQFQPVEKTIYLYCPNGYGKTRLTNGFFENLLKCPATTRNWKTTLELFRIISNKKVHG